MTAALEQQKAYKQKLNAVDERHRKIDSKELIGKEPVKDKKQTAERRGVNTVQKKDENTIRRSKTGV